MIETDWFFKNYIGQMKWQYVLKNALREMRVWTMHRGRLERRQRVNGGQRKEWYAIFYVSRYFLTHEL